MEIAAIFQSGMILQRDKPVKIWGTANPNAEISLSIQGKNAETVSDASGRWRAELPALDASEQETLTVASSEGTVVLEDVAVGEVWVAGGQSNMEFYIRYEKHKDEVFPTCEDPRIRFFDVPKISYAEQRTICDYSQMGIWRKATRNDLDYFSAVGYYFQKELESSFDVPVGIVGCNWGGTVSAAWMDPATIEQNGGPWMEEYRKHLPELKTPEYWDAQKLNPMMDSAHPFNEFNEVIMPRTLTDDELEDFFSKLQYDGGSFSAECLAKDVPGCLFENMVKSIAPFSVRGVLWYQGESDDEKGHSDLYADMLTGLIGDWRKLWEDVSLPFLIVQLPGFLRWMMNPPGNNYMEIRHCQERVTRTVPNSYLCSISDVGEELDIHPKNKKAVGYRLALLARGHVYGEHILCDAPVAVEAGREKEKVNIRFAHTGGELTIKGDALNAMDVTSDGDPLSFRAQANGDTLTLIFKCEVRKPLHINFAQSCWYEVNLFNKAGIPAVPFQLSI